MSISLHLPSPGAGTPPSSEFLIQARGLCKVYQRGALQVEALRHVDLQVPRGEFVIIFGPSGGGKSTLLHILGGIDRPTAGQVQVNGTALERASEAALARFRRDHIGFVFQFYNLLPSLNAIDNVALPLLAKGLGRRQAHKRSLELLSQMGLEQRTRHKPAELSGGEQQRVAIARALAANPLLLLADEPTGDLDSANAHEIVEQMAMLNRTLKLTIILATHNPSLAGYASQIYHMQDGRLALASGVS
jgi:putative ABC transport system ATP-binding protein